ncbi:MAG: TorF family putative porin [Alphaproteobacteria bacterium]|nr:TorF family putative porin [Alphaproteobacteria bacterium]
MNTKLGLTGSVFALAVAGAVLATAASAGEWFDRGGSVKDAPMAESGRSFEWSVNGGLMTDYVFRGISQNQEDPSWFVGADASYGIIYAGIWAAEVGQPFTSSDAEYDIYAGITPSLGAVSFDFGVIYYGYANQNSVTDVDYWEFKAGASTEIQKISLGVTYFYSPDDTFEVGPSHVVEGKIGYSLPKVWIFDPSVSALIGYKDNPDLNFEYTYWNAGLELAVEKLSFDFRYWDTDVETIIGGKNLSDERFVFTAKVALP